MIKSIMTPSSAAKLKPGFLPDPYWLLGIISLIVTFSLKTK